MKQVDTVQGLCSWLKVQPFALSSQKLLFFLTMSAGVMSREVPYRMYILYEPVLAYGMCTAPYCAIAP